MYLNISNISNKSKIDFPEKLKYSDVIKLNTPMEIKVISIKDWLAYYNLEDYSKYFGKNCLKFDSVFDYSRVINNYDLIKHVFSRHTFFQDLKRLVESVNKNSYLKTKKSNTQQIINNRIKADLFKFITGYNFIISQENEYKKLLSIIGNNPTNAEYKNILKNSKILDFLDTKAYKEKNIFKDVIFEKLNLLDFDDLINMGYHRALKKYLSVELELIKNFNFITKNKENIKTGCDPSMTKTQFKKFIENNKYLEYLVSCDNVYTLEDIKKSLLEYDVKEFLESERIDLFTEVIKPLNMIPTKIAVKIFDFIFPNEEQIFTSKRMNFLNTIPRSKFIKPKKFKVFFINGHGNSCILDDYKYKKRVDISKIIENFNKKTLKGNMSYSEMKKRSYLPKDYITIINSQPLGRYSILNNFETFNNLLSDPIYRKNIVSSLLNAYKREHFDVIEKLFNIYIYKNLIKPSYDSKGSFEEKIENFEESTKNPYLQNYYYGTTKFTNENFLNFTKYNFNNLPPQVSYSFGKNNKSERLLGIFELNLENECTINNIINKLNFKTSNNQKGKLGLDLREMYEYRGDVPKDHEKVFKYNKLILESNKELFNLEEIINLILDNTKINNDEHIIIISNHCRGLKKTIYDKEKHFNTYFNMDIEDKAKINKLRKNSINRAEESLRRFNIKKTPPKIKKTRRKRGTKRKGAQRSFYNNNVFN